MRKIIVAALLLIAFHRSANAQTAGPAANIAPAAPPFWADILAFKNSDAAEPPPEHPILFAGSSSFAKWKDIASYFPGYPIINRGFGGSTLPDVIRYTYDVILPYHPKQVVIYCGENDLVSPSVTAAEVLLRFKTLYGIIRQNLPDATIDFVSIKASPSRRQIFPKVREANALISQFLEKEKNATFIDIYPAMLDAGGNPRGELFLQDSLHMQPAGYAVWQKIILPYLIK
ncbi:MAG TPA: GDSL-type esterase/lipase family protein [Puia sp.]|nr:GDSL-type esterase/lipase family protein [Puia sp.]